MRFFSIRRVALTLGASAVLVLSAGWVPGLSSGAPTAQAAELAHHHSPGGHHGGFHRGSHNGGHHGGFQHVQHGGFHHYRHWAHVPSSFHHYHGPHHSYARDWYYHRHLSSPWLYQVYYAEPVGACTTEYYFYEGAYYCFVGS